MGDLLNLNLEGLFYFGVYKHQLVIQDSRSVTINMIVIKNKKRKS